MNDRGHKNELKKVKEGAALAELEWEKEKGRLEDALKEEETRKVEAVVAMERKLKAAEEFAQVKVDEAAVEIEKIRVAHKAEVDEIKHIVDELRRKSVSAEKAYLQSVKLENDGRVLLEQHKAKLE